MSKQPRGGNDVFLESAICELRVNLPFARTAALIYRLVFVSKRQYVRSSGALVELYQVQVSKKRSPWATSRLNEKDMLGLGVF